jgi:hypothetical protein
MKWPKQGFSSTGVKLYQFLWQPTGMGYIASPTTRNSDFLQHFFAPLQDHNRCIQMPFGQTYCSKKSGCAATYYYDVHEDERVKG